MPPIARVRTPDDTLALLLEGYEYIPRRCQRYATDLFQTRLLLEPVICMRGSRAARLIYDNDRFIRSGAAPGRVVKTLFGAGGVQVLDGDAHRHRKHLFVELTSPSAADRLADQLAREWNRRLPDWETARRIVLFEEMGRLLCRAVCAWAGVPLHDSEVQRRTNQLHALIDAPVAVGPRHWRGRIARRQADRWAQDLVRAVRAGALAVAGSSPLAAIAGHRDADGTLLPAQTAAVELLNLLRPTVAVDRFVVFAALALHRHPGWRERIAAGDDATGERFVQEVRRTAPFFPLIGARVRAPFDWNGVHFPSGRLVLLDLYGTNHDRRVWPDPAAFDPDRFRTWQEDAYELVPQGGGDVERHHRCPGELMTIAVLKTAVAALTRSMEYAVPPQDLSVNPARIPAIPRSGFVMSGVRRMGTAVADAGA